MVDENRDRIHGPLPQGHASAPALWVARESLIQAVHSQHAVAVVLTGPSGIGKSDLLGAVQERDRLLIAPSPYSLEMSAGALQRGLIDQLGNALTRIAD